MPIDLTVRLPKWPQVLITGRPVSQEQAEEIIFRTDTFFIGWSGNDHTWIERTYKRFGLDYEGNRTESNEASQARWKRNEDILKHIGYVKSEYVHNTWISSSYIGGPHGWCHPNGLIRFTGNVGKWPSVGAIVEDFQRIIKAFPFLKMAAKIMSGEEHEDTPTVPLVQLRISKRGVCGVPLDKDVFKGFDDPSKSTQSIADMVSILGSVDRERGISPQVIDKWAAKVRPFLISADRLPSQRETV